MKAGHEPPEEIFVSTTSHIDVTLELREVCVEHHDLVVYQTAKKREDWYCRQWHYPEQTKCRILNLWMEVPG